MTADAFFKCRVSLAAKAALRTAAQRQQLTESALVLRLLESALQIDVRPMRSPADCHRSGSRNARITVRLQPDDKLLLAERAAARRLPASSYVSALVRSHLRHLAPLPREELRALKQAVAELGTVGRLLNQLVKAAHHGASVPGPSREHVGAMLKIAEGLRDHVSALLKANVTSWTTGYTNGQLYTPGPAIAGHR